MRVVHSRTRSGITEISLGIGGVIEPPVGHRCSSDCRVKDVRSREHRQRGKIAAERPAADTYPRGVDVIGIMLCNSFQRCDLILERDGGKTVAHGTLPGIIAAR